MHVPGAFFSSLRRKAWKAAEIIFVIGLRSVSRISGRPAVRKTQDRLMLDKTILPHFAGDTRYGRVLFVGCDWYTQHYEALFPGRDFTTLEVDPSRSHWGARKHITGDLASLDVHFAAESLDLIVCNGVIGWGLDEPEAIEAAMRGCVKALSPGGALIIGWNDIPEKTPVPLDSIRALGELEAFPGPFESVVRTKTYNHHSFKVLRRPLKEGPHAPPFAEGELTKAS